MSLHDWSWVDIQFKAVQLSSDYGFVGLQYDEWEKIQNMGYIPEGAMYHWFFIKCTQAAGVQSLSIMNE